MKRCGQQGKQESKSAHYHANYLAAGQPAGQDGQANYSQTGQQDSQKPTGAKCLAVARCAFRSSWKCGWHSYSPAPKTGTIYSPTIASRWMSGCKGYPINQQQDQSKLKADLCVSERDCEPARLTPRQTISRIINTRWKKLAPSASSRVMKLNRLANDFYQRIDPGGRP